MSTRANSLAERKQQVLARAELERLRIRVASGQARALLAPASDRRTTWARPRAATLLAIAVPLLGRARLGRMLRLASMGMGVLRLVGSLRR